METLHRIAMAIETGTIECGLALGAERMGRGLTGGATGPQNRNTKLNPRLFQMNDVQKRMAHDHDQTFSVPFPDYILNSPPLQAMVQTAQNAAECYGLTRVELDAFSAESHRKAAAATEAGIYKDEIIPLEVEDPVFDEKGEWNENETGKKVLFEKDECIRADTTPEKLAALQAIKGVMSFGGKEVIITAGNSCPTNDAVSAALLMSEALARKLGLTPLARVIGIGVGGVKPQVMGLGPIPSTKKALRHAGIEAGQLDRVEFNEAFASQVIPCLRDLGGVAGQTDADRQPAAQRENEGADEQRQVPTPRKAPSSHPLSSLALHRP